MVIFGIWIIHKWNNFLWLWQKYSRKKDFNTKKQQLNEVFAYLLHVCSSNRRNAFCARWPVNEMRNDLSYNPDRFCLSNSLYGSISEVNMTFWFNRRHMGHSFCLHNTRIPMGFSIWWEEIKATEPCEFTQCSTNENIFELEITCWTFITNGMITFTNREDINNFEANHTGFIAVRWSICISLIHLSGCI